MYCISVFTIKVQSLFSIHCAILVAILCHAHKRLFCYSPACESKNTSHTPAVSYFSALTILHVISNRKETWKLRKMKFSSKELNTGIQYSARYKPIIRDILIDYYYFLPSLHSTSVTSLDCTITMKLLLLVTYDKIMSFIDVAGRDLILVIR